MKQIKICLNCNESYISRRKDMVYCSDHCANQSWGKRNRSRRLKVMAEQRVQRKVRVMTHYGNGIAKCVQCGESRLACLTIDHINGGGGQHRQRLGRAGTAFYEWLINQVFPSGYQTLCSNCQLVKRVVNSENNAYLGLRQV